MDRIPIAGPWITQKEIDYVADAAANAWYGNAGTYQARFESAFADYLGVGHALALPSCTSAIHLALAALGVGPGDEVVVPDITWIASAVRRLSVLPRQNATVQPSISGSLPAVVTPYFSIVSPT